MSLGLFARKGTQVLAVEVDFDATVKDLMLAVSKAFQESQPRTLRYQDSILEPEMPVADTGLCSECTVEVADDDVVFIHVEPFDKNGLIYFLGSLGRTKEFENPADRRLVKCEKDPAWGESASRWVGRTDHYNRTDIRAEPWFQVDLRVVSIAPTHYSLCFGRDCFDYILKSWSLRGSNDGETWEEVDTRKDDATFRDALQGGEKPYHHGTWEVSQERQRPYKMFRVIGLGNWDNDDEVDGESRTYLHICKIELYGYAKFQDKWQESTF